MPPMEILDGNLENIREYGFCGFKNPKQEGFQRKMDWLKKRFSEGLRFKILYEKDKGSAGFIEYIPGEFAWRPVEAPGYMVIHCLMIHRKEHKGKGCGSMLLEHCLEDAEKSRMHGVAAVTSEGTWMAGSGLFKSHGFETVDSALPSYSLMARKSRKAPAPRFAGDWEKKLKKYGSGLVILRSDQCPCLPKFTKDILEACKALRIPARIVELKNAGQARNAPSAYGIFNIIYNGRVIADHPVSRTRFMNIMKKLED